MAPSSVSSASESDPESPIRVVVTPAQSSYFAGETLSVTITFTNTHSPADYAAYPYTTYASPATPAPAAPTSSRATSYTHKRGSHSITSAPLARPPTSPGMPSRSVVVPGLGTNLASSMLGWRGGARGKSDGEREMPTKKGLVGRPQRAIGKQNGEHTGPVPSSVRKTPATTTATTNETETRTQTSIIEMTTTITTTDLDSMSTSKSDFLPELIEQRRKRLLAKSLSVSISPGELEKQLPEGTLAKATSPRSPSLAGFGSGSLSMPVISESNSSSRPPQTESQSQSQFQFQTSGGSRSPSPPSTTTTTSPALGTPSASASTAPSSPIFSSTSDINGSGYAFPPPQFASTSYYPQGQPVIGLGPPPKGSKDVNANSTTYRQALVDIPLFSAPPYMKPSYSHPHLQAYQSQPHLPHHTQGSDRAYPHPYLQPRTASSLSSPSFSTPSHPQSELILYAYAHLTGSLVLLPLVNSSSANINTGTGKNTGVKQETHAMKKLRAKLTKQTVIGGGSMDITPSLQSMQRGPSSSSAPFLRSPGVALPTSLAGVPDSGSGIVPGTGTPHTRRPRPRIRATHARSPSLAAGFFSNLLSPTSPSPTSSTLTPSPSPSPSPSSPATPTMPGTLATPGSTGRSTFTSMATHKPSMSLSGVGEMQRTGSQSRDRLGAEGTRKGGIDSDEVAGVLDAVDPEAPLPMFDSQASMLAVDLSLGPGESKSCTFLFFLSTV
ncbi:hypothetical protein AX15_005539 [Amanita polypyramis BW_CC]|nr:hypothetical protein AX15_005539 [Amanita polypyramis BW_CC]